MAKYNRIGVNYNTTRSADPFLTEQLITYLKPNPFGEYLDIGCGTGNYTNALHQKGFKCIGIDPSELMLEKAKSVNSNIKWLLGTAEQTNLKTTSIDGIIGILTIHHWEDLHNAFAELHRILKPKRRIVIFTSTPKQMQGYWLNHYFPKMLQDSIVQMPSLKKVKSAITYTGLTVLQTVPYFIRPDLKDQFLYCGKHNPELYFKAQIRQGISSFSDLSNKKLVGVSIKQLFSV